MRVSGVSGIKAVDVWDVLLTAITTGGSIGELIESEIKEAFYSSFPCHIDDLAGIVASGDCTEPGHIIDDDTVATVTTYTVVNQYAQFNLPCTAYVKRIRIHWAVASNAANRYKIQAYVDGAWIDVLVNLVDGAANVWSAWYDLTTPSVSSKWRVTNTTYAANSKLIQIELDGVTIG